MKRKYLLSLLTVALVIPCVVLLAACGGATAGFSSQRALARAYVNMEGRMPMAAFGEGPSLNDLIRFSYDANSLGGVLGLMNEIYDAQMKEAKAMHDAMWKGTWVTEWNADGTVKTRMSTEERDGYRQFYRNARSTSRSYALLPATAVDVARTAAAAADVADFVGPILEGRVQQIEVWKVEWEFYQYTGAGVKGDKQTDYAFVTMVKIGGKWYDAKAGDALPIPPLP